MMEKKDAYIERDKNGNIIERTAKGSIKGLGGVRPMYLPQDLPVMQQRIEDYFADCDGEMLLAADGSPKLNKWGQPIIIGAKPPTITGLALAIGFNSRQGLLNYSAKEAFYDTIARAKAVVEQYAESRLFDKDGANGARFSLSNNFKGWSERQQVETVNVNVELKQLSTEERLQRIEELQTKLLGKTPEVLGE